ncbi:MAG: dihydroorotate dehydrogenase electron transfer subunit [Treponema sp.]|jgi:NAD(P)H-flavin reductase|nr:dihydroorotate dehydrogenase electron transfer subunit [Treponema sp.]
MSGKQSGLYMVVANKPIDDDMFRLAVAWKHAPPRAGQFFLIKSGRSSVLLGRPISVAHYDGYAIHFLIMKLGTGTRELAGTREGETIFMIGPLGNGWSDILPGAPQNGKLIAFVSGGLGCASLLYFAEELAARSSPSFHFYAGFSTASPELTGMITSLPVPPQKLIVTTDDGSDGEKGVVTDALDAGAYAAVFSCGATAMLKAVAETCAKAGTPCFISAENHMACGVGACLGCAVKTASGNKRCCADGPVFNAREVIFA